MGKTDMKNKTFLGFVIVTILLNVAFLVSGILFWVFGYTQPYIAIFITLFMFAYHLDIRCIVGFIGSMLRRRTKIDRRIYRVSKKEYDILGRLKVGKWKDHFITMFKDRFVMKSEDRISRTKEILQNNINAETTHWIGFLLGFLAIPLGWLISSDEMMIYVITSILGGLIDIPPIMIQRYNRHRLQVLLERMRNREQKDDMTLL